MEKLNNKENITLDGMRYLEFDLGEEHYAVKLLLVREVIPVPETTPIPKSPSYFLGIMNLRGHVISIVDLRKKLAISPKENNTESAVIIVDVNDVQIGVIVDSINRVLSVTEKTISNVPEINTQVNAKYIEGVHRQEDKLTVLLDISSALDIQDLSIAKNSNKSAA